MDVEGIFDRWTGFPPVARTAVTLTASRLRILAYHGIEDRESFAMQMEWVKKNLNPVTAWEVIGWIDGGRLPSRAVWITFDDGDPSVVANGLDALKGSDLPSTMFICPGVVDTLEPFWWHTAQRAGLGPMEIENLKLMPDRERRRIIGDLKDRMADVSVPWQRSQITTRQIESYLDAGGSIGNHTWDHPCLDRCDETEQERQITRAHEWISGQFPGQPPVFAYPNGNHAPAAERILQRLGYRIGALFDHRFAAGTQSSMALSRLRTDSDSGLDRFRSVLGGIHPQVHRWRGRVSRLVRRVGMR